MIAPPYVPPQEPSRPPTFQRYGASICTHCGMEVDPHLYCGCAKRAAEQPSNDAQPTADLNQRIREVRYHMDVLLPSGFVRFCALCGKTMERCAGRCE